MVVRHTFKPAFAVLVACLGAAACTLADRGADVDPAALPAAVAAVPGTPARAGLVVSYDGAPRFEEIPGTSLLYAGNASAQVLKSGDRYYAVDEGIWYTSDSADGPWSVAASRPDEVADIPPGSPAYNLKYVYLYDFTPDGVPAGYQPGYPPAVPYRGPAAYGVGYAYRHWMSPPWYYPRPGPWEYSLFDDPWYGWSSGYRPPPDPGPRRGFRPPERKRITTAPAPATAPATAPGTVVRPPPRPDDPRTTPPMPNPARMRRGDGDRGERR